MVGNHVFVENIVSEFFFPQIQYLNERVYSEKSFFRKSSILVHWYIFSVLWLILLFFPGI
jgi:hypothetical protein